MLPCAERELRLPSENNALLWAYSHRGCVCAVLESHFSNPRRLSAPPAATLLPWIKMSSREVDLLASSVVSDVSHMRMTAKP
jgi:hypothetical protein